MILLQLSACLFISESELQARLGEISTPDTDSDAGFDSAAGDSAETGSRDTGATDTGTPDTAQDSADTASDSGDTGTLQTYYPDNDADGSGARTDEISAYSKPEGYVENAWDCNDADATEPVWVAVDGLATGPGGFDTPFAEISPAVAAAYGCVRIRAGVYKANIDLGGHNLDIEGVDGPALTTVSAAGSGPVLSVDGGETATVRGLTITGGTGTTSSNGTFGGGVIVINPATLSLYETIITANSATNGGGIYSTSPFLELNDVKILANDGYAGGAFLQEGGVVTAEHVLIANNTGGYGTAGYVSAGEFSMRNSIVNANRGSIGIDGFYLVASATSFVNTAIVDHDYGLGADAGESGKSQLTVVNTIVGGGEFGLVLYGENQVDVQYTWFFGHSGRDWYPDESNQIGLLGNNSLDPEFVDFGADGNGENDDLQLAPISPAIDAGDPTILDVNGTASDVGAYGGPGGVW